jgi:hypothetical protein
MAKKDAEKQAEMTASATPKFNFMFVVVNQFGDYKKGDRISDDDAIQAIIDAGDDINCNRIPR